MRSNELRIGNLIYFNSCGNYQVREVNARFFSSLAGGRSSEKIKNDEELSEFYCGIPLTTEILEKCGFKPITTGSVDGSIDERFFYSKEYNSELIIVVPKEDHISIRSTNTTVITKLSSIEYVHQLQNLFYSSTGKELEIIL